MLKSTGNATVPEGTKITWKVSTTHTDHVDLKVLDTSYQFTKDRDRFEFQRSIFNKWDYTITTSNENLNDYENLSFTLGVIRTIIDIRVSSKQDSLDFANLLLLGR